VEHLIEGDSQKRKILDKADWNFEKIWKKTLKHILFLLISFFISNIFLAWIIGVDELEKIITEPFTEHFLGLVIMVIFSLAFYGTFAFLREQVCIGVCPYGRLQGVLLDKDSMVVSYDFKRGEPRGKLGATKGDCVDCHLCVAVCPTGIDIRNGTQLECISCTACIDACNSIMQKVHRPEGLIRIASHNQIAKHREFRITSRMIGYAILWTVMISLLGYLVFSRAEVEATIMRAPGQIFQKQNDGTVTNLYTLSLVNNSFNDHQIELKVKSPEHAIVNVVGEPLSVKEAESSNGTFFVSLPLGEITKMKTDVLIDVVSNGKKVGEIKTAFIGPVYKKDHDTKEHHEEKKNEGEDHKDENHKE
jgi:cytochrome c oxidase accessory protein FixG